MNNENIDQYITIGVKTFLRPKCLKNCLESIRKYYKKVPIIVADDSYDSIKKINYTTSKNYNATYLDIEFDSGNAKGKNKIMDSVKTDYYLTFDDDMIMTDQVDLLKCINFLQFAKEDFIGGDIKNRNREVKIYDKIINRDDNYHIIYTNGYGEEIINPYIKAFRCNFMYNIFIAKVESMKKNLWKNKIGDHKQFFIDWYLKGGMCCYSPELVFDENHISNPEYGKYRLRSLFYQTKLHFITKTIYEKNKDTIVDIPNIIHFICDDVNIINIINILVSQSIYSPMKICVYYTKNSDLFRYIDVELVKINTKTDAYKYIYQSGGILYNPLILPMKNLMFITHESYSPDFFYMFKKNSESLKTLNTINSDLLSKIDQCNFMPFKVKDTKFLQQKMRDSLFYKCFSGYGIYMHDLWIKNILKDITIEKLEKTNTTYAYIINKFVQDPLFN